MAWLNYLSHPLIIFTQSVCCRPSMHIYTSARQTNASETTGETTQEHLHSTHTAVHGEQALTSP